eukprot:scaffold4.g4664.t1
MCMVTENTADQQAMLARLQDDLTALGLSDAGAADAADLAAHKGSGPRLFCGHVPKEVTEEMVKLHFSKYGAVTDVYFPRHKKTLKRRPFCFVSFADVTSAEKAIEDGNLEICGVPIKNLTMVDDRDKYYREKHASARQALLQALQSLACPTSAAAAAAALGSDGAASSGERASPDPSPAASGASELSRRSSSPPGGPAPRVSQDQLASLAALLAQEGGGGEAALAGWLQQAQAAAGARVSLGACPPSARSSISSIPTPGPGGVSLDLPGGLAGMQLGTAAAFYASLGAAGSHASLSTLGDPRSTLSMADWQSASGAPSARESVDVYGPAPDPYGGSQQAAAAAAASFGGPGAGALPALAPGFAQPAHHRLSFDAALHLQHLHQLQAAQQHEALMRLSFQGMPPPRLGEHGAPPSPQALAAALAAAQQQQQQQQQAAAAALAYQSSFYQPAAGGTYGHAPLAMQSSLYASAVPPVRSSAPGGLYAPGAPPAPPRSSAPGNVSLAMQSSFYAAPPAAPPPEPPRGGGAPGLRAGLQPALPSALYRTSFDEPAARGSGAVSLDYGPRNLPSHLCGASGCGLPPMVRSSINDGRPPLPRAPSPPGAARIPSPSSDSPQGLPPGLPAIFAGVPSNPERMMRASVDCACVPTRCLSGTHPIFAWKG